MAVTIDLSGSNKGSSLPTGTTINTGTPASQAVQASFNKYLNRDAGSTGLDYWVPEWESNKAKAIASGMSDAAAAASATASLEKNLGLSSERFDLISGKTTAGSDTFDKSSLGIPDDFTFQEENLKLGARPEDWASDVISSNVEKYMSDINDQYGMQQGNVVGTEGLDWWGYQMTQGIQSHLAHGDDYNTAYKKAIDSVSKDIGLNTGAINYDKYGSIGYGSPVNVITGYNDRGEPILGQKYLQLSDLTDKNKVGTKSATQYQIDEDGKFVVDDDGNQIPTGNTATPFSWKLVADDSAPGGYKHVPVGFDTGDGVLSTKGQNFIMENYVNDDGKNTFSYNTGLSNVGIDKFTDGTLDYGPWNVTPAGIQDIANNNFAAKNKGFQDLDGDGNLDYVPSNFDHSQYDSNLGLGPNDQLKINWGGGWETGFTGSPTSTLPPFQIPTTAMGGGSGSGNTIVNLDMNQKSTTAADQAAKADIKGQTSGQGKKGFNTTWSSKHQPKGNISTLGIVS